MVSTLGVISTSLLQFVLDILLPSKCGIHMFITICTKTDISLISTSSNIISLRLIFSCAHKPLSPRVLFPTRFRNKTYRVYLIPYVLHVLPILPSLIFLPNKVRRIAEAAKVSHFVMLSPSACYCPFS